MTNQLNVSQLFLIKFHYILLYIQDISRYYFHSICDTTSNNLNTKVFMIIIPHINTKREVSNEFYLNALKWDSEIPSMFYLISPCHLVV